MARTTPLAAALAAILCAPATGQVVINEVLYDPVGADSGNEIIELRNQGGTTVAIGNWSICVNGLGTSRVYWGIPAGTTIDPGALIQIHWRASGANTPTDLFASGGFTCGQPAMDLNNTRGSVGLYDIPATSCAGFGGAGNIVDFVQWGSSGTLRESVAVNAGIWSSGDFVPAVLLEGDSIAYDGSGNSSADYFEDNSPTLGAVNTAPGNALAVNYGTACDSSAGSPVFETKGGPPALGNLSFAFNVGDAPIGNTSVLFLSASAAAIPVVGCDPGILVGLGGSLRILHTVGPDLPVPLAFPFAVGTQLYCQWIIVDLAAPSGRGIAMSDGLEITF